eukprot:1969338-Rhodomonas_salina.1
MKGLRENCEKHSPCPRVALGPVGPGHWHVQFRSNSRMPVLTMKFLKGPAVQFRCVGPGGYPAGAASEYPGHVPSAVYLGIAGLSQPPSQAQCLCHCGCSGRIRAHWQNAIDSLVVAQTQR